MRFITADNDVVKISTAIDNDGDVVIFAEKGERKAEIGWISQSGGFIPNRADSAALRGMGFAIGRDGGLAIVG